MRAQFQFHFHFASQSIYNFFEVHTNHIVTFDLLISSGPFYCCAIRINLSTIGCVRHGTYIKIQFFIWFPNVRRWKNLVQRIIDTQLVKVKWLRWGCERYESFSQPKIWKIGMGCSRSYTYHDIFCHVCSADTMQHTHTQQVCSMWSALCMVVISRLKQMNHESMKLL